jgi:enoyl-CoA hydratase/carnithine racemase
MAPETPTTIRNEVAEGVATLTLNRPESLNALNSQMRRELLAALKGIARDDAVRAVILTGEGRGFCSGADLRGGSGERDFRTVLEREYNPLIRAIRELPKPVIAAVNGVAAGAGAVIALAADFRLLARSASLAFLFTRVGLAGADMGSAYLLPRLVGLARATELLLLGDRVDAERAAALGLATEVVDDQRLGEAAGALAARLASGPTLAYGATKALLSRELDMNLSGAIELEAMTQALLLRSEDHAEFYKAFTEGRSPIWRGR